MATRKPTFLTEYGVEEMATTDDIALGGLAMSGDITMSSNEVTGLPNVPTVGSAAASKNYVDAVANDSRPKGSVKAATTGALPAYTAAGSGVGKTLTADASGAWSSTNSDGVSLSQGDRFLVKDENSGGAHVDHGIYTLTTVGDAGNPWVLTRATDFDEDSEVIAGAHTWVDQGDTLDNTTWSVVTNDPITVDTTTIDFTQTQGPGTYTAGDGISIASGEIAVDLAATNPCLEFDGSGDLQFQINGTTLEKTSSGAQVKGLPSLFEINGSAVSSNVTAANLDELTGGGVTTLHSHSSGVATRIEEDLTAEETLSLGDPVEWGTTNDQVRKCQADTTARIDCMGVVTESGGISASSSGSVVRLGKASGVISTATVGDRYYVGSTGGLVQGIGTLSGGEHIILVGNAINATDLEVKPQYIGRKAA